jgi:hypothetical protein
MEAHYTNNGYLIPHRSQAPSISSCQSSFSRLFGSQPWRMPPDGDGWPAISRGQGGGPFRHSAGRWGSCPTLPYGELRLCRGEMGRTEGSREGREGRKARVAASRPRPHLQLDPAAHQRERGGEPSSARQNRSGFRRPSLCLGGDADHPDGPPPVPAMRDWG